MIIPPDPDKDPALLSPSSSTPSLLPPPTESSSSIRQPEVAHRNPAFGYPFGDDLGLGFTGEALPPYEGRRVRQARMEGHVNRDRQRQQGIIIPPRPRSASTSTITPSPIATSSTSHLPTTHPSHEAGPSTTSASKLWESSDSTRTKRRRCLPALPIPPRLRKWWKRWRRYVQAALVLLMIGIGVMIGMLVGFRRKPDGSPPPQDADGMSSDGRRTTSWNIVSPSLTHYKSESVD